MSFKRDGCCDPHVVVRFFSSDVDSYRGFVKQEDAGMTYHRLRNEDALNFPTGKFKSNVVPLVFWPLGWVWEGTNNGAKLAVLGVISHKANSGAARQVGNVFWSTHGLMFCIASRIEIYDLVRRLQEQRHTACILISHDLHTLSNHADRVPFRKPPSDCI